MYQCCFYFFSNAVTTVNPFGASAAAFMRGQSNGYPASAIIHVKMAMEGLDNDTFQL
jgi:hypothetical protein